MNSQDFQHIIQPFLNDFSQEEGYFDDDKKRIMYFKNNPLNENSEEIVIKISTMEHNEIDQLINSRRIMGDHIASLSIDAALQQGSPDVVSSIAHLEVRHKPYFFYSFATRYCNWHRMDAYPVYDLAMHKVLEFYWKATDQGTLLTDELFYYPRFKELVVSFRQQLLLDALNFKELDKFIWIYGNRMLREATQHQALLPH